MPRASRSVRSRPARVVPRRQPAASSMRTLARRRVTAARASAASRPSYWANVKRRWAEGGGPNKAYYQAAGSLIGGTAGSVLGGIANRGLYALTGYGDYTVRSNVLLETNGPPSVVNRSNKEFVVRHREYITDVYSLAGAANTPSAFGLQSYSINPGDATTFPWLSTISDKFEQYRIEGMVFEFKSLYSDAVVTQNGSIGSIVLATEYNAGAPGFTSKQAMENYQFAQSCKPSGSVLHPIECARPQNVLSELYIRPAALPSGEDIKTYDFGNFQIASQGIPLGSAGAAVNLGELWVSYQIALIKPRIPTGPTTYKDSGFAYFSGIPGDPTNPALMPWGINPCPIDNVVRRSSTNLEITLVSDNTFRIPCGSTIMCYQYDLYWYALSSVDPTPWRGPGVTLTNGSFVNGATTGSYQQVRSPLTLSAGSRCSSHGYVIVPAATPSVTFCTFVVQSSTFGADQGVGVRFEGFFNAVPYPLT